MQLSRRCFLGSFVFTAWVFLDTSPPESNLILATWWSRGVQTKHSSPYSLVAGLSPTAVNKYFAPRRGISRLGVIRLLCSPGFRSAESRLMASSAPNPPFPAGYCPPDLQPTSNPPPIGGWRSDSSPPHGLRSLALGSRSAQARAASVPPIPFAGLGPSDPHGSRSAQACAASLARSPRSLPSSRLALCLGPRRRVPGVTPRRPTRWSTRPRRHRLPPGLHPGQQAERVRSQASPRGGAFGEAALQGPAPGQSPSSRGSRENPLQPPEARTWSPGGPSFS